MSDLLSGVNLNNAMSTSNLSNSSIDNTVNANYEDASTDELYEACKSFETYFIEKMFKQMYDSIDRTTEKGDYVEMFEDTLITEYATAATDQGGIGLAQVLYEQMKVNYQK